MRKCLIHARLRPARRDGGFRIPGKNVWCGSVISAEGGWHAFSSVWPVREDPERYGPVELLQNYWRLSTVVHAEADNPEGPYQFKALVLEGQGGAHWVQDCAHNPCIVRAGDEYVLYFQAKGKEQQDRYIGYATADSIHGPWRYAPAPLELGYNVTNPAVWVEHDNSIRMAFRTPGMKIAIAVAESYDAPYRIVKDDILRGVRLEDPFLWRMNDEYHLIAEDTDGRFAGGKRYGVHLVSKDGEHFEVYAPEPMAYSHRVEWQDGGFTDFDRRERPWLILQDGVPTHLVNGVLLGEESHSLVQPLATIVKQDVMDKIYDEVKTPYKYGIVLKGEDGLRIDCPNVFRHGERWLMMYVCMNKVGYETHLAESDDLLSWKPMGKILSFPKDGWDQWQADGGVALMDPAWGGSCTLGTFDDKYWLSYIGGALQGYETDPLAIGMAWTDTPDAPVEWTRIPENPVLSREQPDVRDFETVTLYKSNIIRDEAESLGFPFVMFYNAKAEGGERIGMAVSKDMVQWRRYGTEPVIANGKKDSYGISGDPQIVRMDDVWVMFYFGAFWKPKAFDTFACSYDLVHWTKWNGPHLIEPSEPWDAGYAHKPWLIKHNGVVYHYYCAVGDQGRVIALATSKDLRQGRQTGK